MVKKYINEDFDPDDEVPDKKNPIQVVQRRWHLLNLIPTFGRSIAKQDLADRLYPLYSSSLHDNHATQVSKNTFLRYIQRDLSILSEAINARKKEIIVSNRKGVSWSEGGSPFKGSGFSLAETLAFGVLKKFGVQWMPSSLQETLNPYFETAMLDAAARVEERSQNSPRQAELQANKWLSKIETLPDWIYFHRAPINKSVEKAIHEALLQECSLEVVYLDRPKRIIYPQAIIQKGARTYLLATSPERSTLRPYLLNRFNSAVIAGDRFKSVNKSEIQAQLSRGIAQPKFSQIDSHGMPIEYGKPIVLKFIVDKGTYQWLEETPLSKAQKIELAPLSLYKAWSKVKGSAPLLPEIDEGWYVVTATVLLQEELIWWLRSMGPYVKVLEPEFIRERIQFDLQRALANYSVAK